MTREEAKQAIADRCGTTLVNNRENLSYCRFAGCPFGTNLLKNERSPKTGFYFYSDEPFNESSVMGPWLQAKLREAGFHPDEYKIRTNRSSSEVEGHIADFYLDIDWEHLTDGDLSRIRALYDRLKAFQAERWPEDDAVRSNQIRAFNEANAEAVRTYIRNRGREAPDAGESTPPRPIPDILVDILDQIHVIDEARAARAVPLQADDENVRRLAARDGSLLAELSSALRYPDGTNAVPPSVGSGNAPLSFYLVIGPVNAPENFRSSETYVSICFGKDLLPGIVSGISCGGDKVRALRRENRLNELALRTQGDLKVDVGKYNDTYLVGKFKEWTADEIRRDGIRVAEELQRWISQCCNELYVRAVPAPVADDIQLDEWESEARDSLLANFQIVFTGAPGTGKTHAARRIAAVVAGDSSRIASVQFHPGYDYSDFVVGMKPVLISEETGKEIFKDENGNPFTTDTGKKDGLRTLFVGKTEVSFRWTDGIFKTFADAARKAYDAAEDKENAPKFVFLIDEINRADLSRVFGELFSLLEEDYRYPENRMGAMLPDGTTFHLPKNLYVIGTMNDIDRSVESMDFALRRRFAWHEVEVSRSEAIIDEKVRDSGAAEKLKNAMRDLNFEIAGREVDGRVPVLGLRLGSEYQLGGSVFARYAKCGGSFDKLWGSFVRTTLGEYLRGRSNREDLLGELKGIFDRAVSRAADRPVATGETGPEAQ